MIYMCTLLFGLMMTCVHAAGQESLSSSQNILYSQVREIRKIERALGVLDDFSTDMLKKTTIFIDFDDTIAMKRIELDGTKILWGLSLDSTRTYNKQFWNACYANGCLVYQKALNYFVNDTRTFYEIIDSSMADFVSQLKDAGAYVKVLSGQPKTQQRSEILKNIGLTSNDYLYAKGNKTDVLLANLPLDQSIEHIIMIDNSAEYVLNTMRESMSEILQNNSINLTFYPYEHTLVQTALEANDGKDLEKEVKIVYSAYRSTTQTNSYSMFFGTPHGSDSDDENTVDPVLSGNIFDPDVGFYEAVGSDRPHTYDGPHTSDDENFIDPNEMKNIFNKFY